MITTIKQFRELNENIEERKIKFKKENNLRLLQQEILTVDTKDGWLTLDKTWKDINPKYVKTKQINGHVWLKFNEDGHIPEWLENITINGNFICYNNKLTTLKHCPKIIKQTFNCSHNLLTSLEHCPKIINDYFSCSSNKLTSLEDGPIEVGKDYYCNKNKKQFTKEYVKSICNVQNNIVV